VTFALAGAGSLLVLAIAARAVRRPAELSASTNLVPST
jgi:hypothetical protein